jgi:hypothetical protein
MIQRINNRSLIMNKAIRAFVASISIIWASHSLGQESTFPNRIDSEVDSLKNLHIKQGSTLVLLFYIDGMSKSGSLFWRNRSEDSSLTFLKKIGSPIHVSHIRSGQSTVTTLINKVVNGQEIMTREIQGLPCRIYDDYGIFWCISWAREAKSIEFSLAKAYCDSSTLLTRNYLEYMKYLEKFEVK